MKANVKQLLKEGKIGEYFEKLTERQRGELMSELQADSAKEVLTIHDTVLLLGMSAPAIRNAVKRGVLPGAKIGNRLRFNKRAILEALNVRQPQAESKGGPKHEKN